MAQDIDDEIAALDAALLTSFDNASAGYLLTRHQTISNRITALSPGGALILAIPMPAIQISALGWSQQKII